MAYKPKHQPPVEDDQQPPVDDQQPPVEAAGVALIPMTKNGEVLEVDPSCVAAHVAAGWVVVQPI